MEDFQKRLSMVVSYASECGVDPQVAALVFLGCCIEDHGVALARSTRLIAQGETEPGGLESVVMALCGGDPKTETSLAGAVSELARVVAAHAILADK